MTPLACSHDNNSDAIFRRTDFLSLACKLTGLPQADTPKREPTPYPSAVPCLLAFCVSGGPAREVGGYRQKSAKDPFGGTPMAVPAPRPAKERESGNAVVPVPPATTATGERTYVLRPSSPGCFGSLG